MTEIAAPPARNFAAFLSQVEDGELHQALTDAQRDLIAKLIDHARDVGGRPKGRIVVDIGYQLDKSGMIEIVADFKVTTPKTVRGKSVFYPTPENNLSRHNPRQSDMFRDVSAGAPAAPPRAV